MVHVFHPNTVHKKVNKKIYVFFLFFFVKQMKEKLKVLFHKLILKHRVLSK